MRGGEERDERWGRSNPVVVHSNSTGEGCGEGRVARDEGEGARGVMGILAGTGNSVRTSN